MTKSICWNAGFSFIKIGKIYGYLVLLHIPGGDIFLFFSALIWSQNSNVNATFHSCFSFGWVKWDIPLGDHREKGKNIWSLPYAHFPPIHWPWFGRGVFLYLQSELLQQQLFPSSVILLCVLIHTNEDDHGFPFLLSLFFIFIDYSVLSFVVNSSFFTSTQLTFQVFLCPIRKEWCHLYPTIYDFFLYAKPLS